MNNKVSRFISSLRDSSNSFLVPARFITLRRFGMALLALAPLLVTNCGGGGDSGSSVPNTPLVWNAGTWDQVRWQ